MALFLPLLPLYVLLAAGGQAGAPPATVQTSPDKEIATQDVQPSFSFRVQRNMVVVRVIVRDQSGRPVPKLRKEDFRVFDNGKAQVIDQFAVESGRAAAAAPPAASHEAEGKPAAEQAAAPEVVTPQNYQALYFDDMQSGFPDLARARDAAERYLASTLTASSRVGIFTASGQGVLDFTADRERLHEALLQLRPRPMTVVDESECPQMVPYEAYLIVEQNDQLARDAATERAAKCTNPKGAALLVDIEARRLYQQGASASESVLRGLEQVIRRTAIAPGERSVILLSPGFFDYSRGARIYDIAERALRSNVVVNALDPRGLYAIIPGGDASQPSGSIGSPVEEQLLLAGFARAEDVLYDFAAITGGQFFHNDNDLEKGFRQVGTLADVYYVLAFSPRNLKLDGRFHQLKVSLVNPAKLSVQARHGYFAPKASEDAAAKAKEEIEQAMYSQDELRELPIDVHTQFYKVNDTAAKLAVLTHLDMGVVRFHKEADRNRNDVTFVTVLFDLDGKYVAAKEKRVEFRLRDSTLERLIKSGITLKTDFDVKPGTYMVRQIVRDSEAGQLSGLNRTVEIPY
jgi:VWFA-related protein